MSDNSLLYSTGDPVVDSILRGVTGLFERLFPNRIPGYYLTGSYADGSALPSSDIDLTLLFQGRELPGDEEQAVDRVSDLCSWISPIELDVAALPQVILFPLRAVSLKLDSQLLYGEDARAAIPLPSREAYVGHCVDLSLRLLARLHRRPGPLTTPLSWPDPSSEFFGYVQQEERSAQGWIKGGTKDLVTTVGLMATAIVASRADRYVSGKRECLTLYRALIDDEWADFIEAVYDRCRNQWGYRVPRHEPERRLLGELCVRMVPFANHFAREHGGCR